MAFGMTKLEARDMEVDGAKGKIDKMSSIGGRGDKHKEKKVDREKRRRVA